MNQTKIDFQAIMSQPLSVKGMRQIKILTPESIQKLVRAHHPASQRAEQRKPVFVK